jgi:hypothetical protein
MGTLMRGLTLGRLSLIAVPLLILVGCAPEPSPSPTPSLKSATPSQSASPSPAPIPITPDTLAVMTATATAQNGSVLQLRLVVLKSQAWDDPAGLPRSTATTTWCDGELDDTVYKPNNYGFAEVDYSAELSGSKIAWPSDLLVRLLPSPSDSVSVTAGGSAYQIEPPDPNAGSDPGYYVPHCQQPAYLGGAGTGVVYLGFDGDAAATPPFTLWSKQSYGWTFDPINSKIDPSKVNLTNCSLTVTTLGKSLGASASGGAELEKGTYCSLTVSE